MIDIKKMTHNQISARAWMILKWFEIHEKYNYEGSENKFKQLKEIIEFVNSYGFETVYEYIEYFLKLYVSMPRN